MSVIVIQDLARFHGRAGQQVAAAGLRQHHQAVVLELFAHGAGLVQFLFQGECQELAHQGDLPDQLLGIRRHKLLRLRLEERGERFELPHGERLAIERGDHGRVGELRPRGGSGSGSGLLRTDGGRAESKKNERFHDGSAVIFSLSRCPHGLFFCA